MSMKSDGVDLNFGVVSAGVKASNPSGSFDEGDVLRTEALTETIDSESQVADAALACGEIKGSIDALAGKWKGKRDEAGCLLKERDGAGSSVALSADDDLGSDKVGKDSGPMERMPPVTINEDGVDLGDEVHRMPDFCVQQLAEGVDLNPVELKTIGRSNEITGAANINSDYAEDTTGEATEIELAVDVCPHTGADGKLKLENEIGNEVSPGIANTATSFDSGNSLEVCRGSFITEGNKDVPIDKTEKDILIWSGDKNIELGNLELVRLDKECWNEKEGDFYVSDMVWGKVKSHPWWPGQIVDHSAASEKAMKYFKKDSFLVAYFGDKTFAWNYASQLKPFRRHFSQMEKQSGMEAFSRALDSALNEVSRRVEFGLACTCLSEEVYSSIKTQEIVNAGVREESKRRYGGDSFSGVNSFLPAKLVQYLKELAAKPLGGTHRLTSVVARAQLLAFNRWRGYNNLPVPEILTGLMESDADSVSQDESYDIEEREDGVQDRSSHRKGNPQVQDGSPRKRKQSPNGSVLPSRKERCLSDLMSADESSLGNKVRKTEGKARSKKTPLSAGGKRKASNFVSGDTRQKRRKSSPSESIIDEMVSSPKQLPRVGERICRVASKLADSSQILKSSKAAPQKSVRSARKLSSGTSGSRRSHDERVTECPPLTDMLSRICMAATDPMRSCSSLYSTIRFFYDFRNHICFEIFKSSDRKRDDEQKDGPNMECGEKSEFDGAEDSYWTDRIIQSNSREKEFSEPLTADNKPKLDVESFDADAGTTPNTHDKLELPGISPDPEAEKSPTALILYFNGTESIPSVTNLNSIFSQFGPLNESATEVMNKRAKVVFKKRSDADTAFSSAGKFKIFGPSLVSYRLNYLPSPQKTSSPSSKPQINEV